MITQSERDQLGKFLTKVAFGYGVEKTKEQIRVFINVLVEFVPATLDQYVEGINRYMSDKRNRAFPAPMQLRDYIEGNLSNEAKAKEVASRVVHAVSSIGWCSPHKARAYIGDLGWHCVERMGGWLYICENLGVTIQITTFQAQIRDIAAGTIEMASLGLFNKPIGIPGQEKQKSIQSAGEILGIEAPKAEAKEESEESHSEEAKKKIKEAYLKLGLNLPSLNLGV